MLQNKLHRIRKLHRTRGKIDSYSAGVHRLVLLSARSILGGFRADFLASSYRVILTSGLIGTIAVEQFGTIPSDGTTLNRLDSIRWAGNEPKP